MQERIPLDPNPFGPDSWSTPPDASPVSAQGVVVGALVGLAAGLLVNYLALVGSRFVGLPTSAQPLGDSWFAPVLLVSTVIGILYYSRDH